MARKAETSKDAAVAEPAKKALASLEAERNQIIRDWVIASADLLIPTNTLGVFTTNLGVVGAAGTFSSLLALYSIWPQ